MSLGIKTGSAERTSVILNYRLNISENTAKGRKDFRSGNQPSFTGWSKSAVENYLQTSLEAIPATHYDFWRRVIKPLQDLTIELSDKGLIVPAIFAGEEDIPPHITLTRADFKNSPKGELERVKRSLDTDFYMRQMRAILVGSEIAMDTIVIGNASYICTSTPSDLLIGTKRVINQMVAARTLPDNKMQTVPYNLTQVSSLRISEAMNSDAGEAFAYEAYERVGRHLLSNPLVFRVASAFFGTAADHIKNHRPNLLLAA